MIIIQENIFDYLSDDKECDTFYDGCPNDECKCDCDDCKCDCDDCKCDCDDCDDCDWESCPCDGSR